MEFAAPLHIAVPVHILSTGKDSPRSKAHHGPIVVRQRTERSASVSRDNGSHNSSASSSPQPVSPVLHASHARAHARVDHIYGAKMVISGVQVKKKKIRQAGSSVSPSLSSLPTPSSQSVPSLSSGGSSSAGQASGRLSRHDSLLAQAGDETLATHPIPPPSDHAIQMMPWGPQRQGPTHTMRRSMTNAGESAVMDVKNNNFMSADNEEEDN